MAEDILRLDPTLGYVPGPVPADQAEGLSTDGIPLLLQHDQTFSSLPPPPPAPGHDFDLEQALATLHNALTDAVPLLQWFFLLYFVAFNGSYILFNLMSLFSLLRYRREQALVTLLEDEARDEIPFSLIVPVVCSQASAAVAAVHAMLRLDYAEFEIIIVNDGNGDETLEVLIHEFFLAPFPEAYRDRLQTKPVKSIYASTTYPNLRLVYKENGGKADALNAGINCARYPLYCGVEVGFVLQRDSLRQMGLPFVGNPATVAACSSKVGQPGNMFALLQIIEQLRTYPPGLAWWSDKNAMLVLPGAFTVFRKEAVVAAGAYRTDVEDAEMELVMRLHRLLRQAGEPYRITLVPGLVCREHMPETMNALKNQHLRRQRSLKESLALNRQLLFSRRGGVVGGLSFPLVLLFECFGPLIEILGYVVMTALWLFSAISLQAFGSFMLVAIGMGMLLSVSGLVREEMTLHTYSSSRLGSVLKLFAVALLENLGYRQLTAFWRLLDQQRWILRNEAK